MPLRLAAYCGLLAPVTFVVGMTLGGLAQPDAYSSADDSLSDLGALTASSAWLYNQVTANLTGLLVIVFALGLWTALRGNVLGRIGVAALLVFGAGQFLDGIFRLDCQGIDAACVNDSWHSDAHRVESGFTSTALLLAPLILAFAFRRQAEWRPLWIPTLLAVPAVIAGTIVGSALGDGAASRAGALVWFAWLALVALRALKLTPSPA